MEKNTQTILITGSSSGLGRETAIRLAGEGHKVFAGIRRKIDKEELERLNKNITGVYIDITNHASIDKAFWFILKNTEKLDVLINNAGIATAFPVELIDSKKLKEQFDVNTFGAVSVTQKFLPLLKNGKIINISSMAASGIFPYVSAYCASKRALDILFNSLMIENKDNIKVISIKPSSVKTPIWNKSVKLAKSNFDELNEENQAKYSKELLNLMDKALKNNEKAIEPFVVVDKIVSVVNAKHPRPSYNVGFQANMADFISKLPLSVSNMLVKMYIKSFK